jgi:hypothetical protein
VGLDEWFRLKMSVHFDVVKIMKTFWDIERFAINIPLLLLND